MTTIIRAPGRSSHYFHVSNEFARNPDVTPRAARVYLYISSHSENWRLNTSSIASAIGMNEGTVKAALRDLEGLRYVLREREKDSAGRFLGMQYIVFETPQDLEEAQALIANSMGEETTGEKTIGEKTTGGKSTLYKNTNYKKTNSKEHQSKNAHPTGEQDRPAELASILENSFEDWWKLYPRKTGKKAAKARYAAAIKAGAQPEELHRGLVESIAVWRQEGRTMKLIPYPTTWLNQGRWEDEVDNSWEPTRQTSSFMDLLDPPSHQGGPGIIDGHVVGELE